MKKYLLVLFAVLIFLHSCKGGGGFSVSPSSDEESWEYPLSSDISEEYSGNPEENAQFLAEAVKLIEKDNEMTSLIILGGIYKDENHKDGSTVLYPLSSGNEYYYFSSLEELADSVYTEGRNGYVLNFPPYGTKTVKNVSGVTWFSTHYVPDYHDYALTETAKTVFLEKDRGRVSVSTFMGLNVIVPFTRTADGWRMDECLYKIITDNRNASGAGESHKSSAMEIGSAASLTGRCLVINVFVNDGASEWNDTEIASVTARMDDACAFMESMADLYKSSLDIISTGESDSLLIETTEKLPEDMNNFVWIDLLFSGTVYKTLKSYVGHYFDLDSYDNWCVMLHLDKKGRSYAIPCDRSNSDWEYYAAERCVVFHTDDEAYDYYDSPGVYVHELFHLFGAVDLYTPYISDADDARLANYFPNDIMRVIPLDSGLASVSPYTAFKLGWVSYIDGQFLFLED